MFVAFDRVRVINLPSRSDRRRQMRKELQKVGARGEFFPAIKPNLSGFGLLFTSPGMFGSFLSHAAIVREAAQAGERVLILEDDCNFLPRAASYPVPPCDVFYGSHAEDTDEMIGVHCMGFSRRAVQLLDGYLEEYLTPGFELDPQAASLPTYDPTIRPPIDGAYVWFRRRYPELVTHFALLTYQRPSRSDCTPSRLDCIPVVRSAVEAIRQSLVFARDPRLLPR